ncbi:uncharacterized protein [Ptychodera flava]|uniref:uncharacterized protein n=1 Tax=Ptychodera flava TaxID=63121 RepID=UPI003969F2E0
MATLGNTRQLRQRPIHKKICPNVRSILQGQPKSRSKPKWKLLPPDIFIRIFSFVSPSDRCNLRIVNSTFKGIIDHPTNWTSKSIRLCNVQRYDDNAWQLIETRNLRCIELGKLSKKNFKKFSKKINCLRKLRVMGPMKVSHLQSLQCQKEWLREFTIRDSSLLSDTELIQGITHFKQLTKLELGNINSLRNESLKGLVKLKNLQSLTLCKANTPYQYGFQITGSGLQYVLFRLPNLRSLTLFAVNGMDFSLSTVFTSPYENPGLEENDNEVDLGNSPEGEVCEDKPLTQLNLETLNLPFSLNFPLSDLALKQLETVTNLSLHESYLLRRRDLSKHDVMRIFKRLKTVKKLDLSSSNCQNEVLANLPSTVEWLDLRDCYSVSILGIHSLAEVVGPKLKYLGLALCNRLSAPLISSFSRLFPNLEELDLSCCRAVTTAHFKVFLQLKRLRILRLVGCPQITEDSIQKAREESQNRILITGPYYIYKKDKR